MILLHRLLRYRKDAEDKTNVFVVPIDLSNLHHFLDIYPLVSVILDDTRELQHL